MQRQRRPATLAACKCYFNTTVSNTNTACARLRPPKRLLVLFHKPEKYIKMPLFLVSLMQKPNRTSMGLKGIYLINSFVHRVLYFTPRFAGGSRTAPTKRFASGVLVSYRRGEPCVRPQRRGRFLGARASRPHADKMSAFPGGRGEARPV